MPYTRKFKVGDGVLVKDKAPLWLCQAIRVDRKRTVVAVFYDQSTQHVRYYLGGNYMGLDISNYPFRAGQLDLVVDRNRGRPRLKRKYCMRKGAKGSWDTRKGRCSRYRGLCGLTVDYRYRL